jgi:hypothetical protein
MAGDLATFSRQALIVYDRPDRSASGAAADQ